MLKIAVCDDETIAVANIEKMLEDISSKVAEDIEIDVFYDGSNLIEHVNRGYQYDILYLDIEMAVKDGVDTAKAIRRSANIGRHSADKGCLSGNSKGKTAMIENRPRLSIFIWYRKGTVKLDWCQFRYWRKEHGMKLSRYEQEVVINFNADESEATIYTANLAWIRKMDKLCKEFPEVIRLKSWTEVSKTYVLPKNLVRIGKPRTLSEAQLRHLRELQNRG